MVKFFRLYVSANNRKICITKSVDTIMNQDIQKLIEVEFLSSIIKTNSYYRDL